MFLHYGKSAVHWHKNDETWRREKREIEHLFGKIKDVQDLDYVTGWYQKAAQYIQNTSIETGFVSTNSICQGAQVPILRKVLPADTGVVLTQKEAVCDAPKMNFGNQPRDGGHFVIKEEERKEILSKEPELEKWLRPYIGADEFIKGKKRWCLWLKDASPSDIAQSKILYQKVAALYHFGILTSNVHMAWTRVVCGRLKSDYRYTKELVYNTFPWPNPSKEQRQKIEETAKNILAVRVKYFPASSMALLYDPVTMPADLETAHRKNDIAVMKAYGFDVNGTSERDCVAGLMKRYHEIAGA